jgi:protein-tyrosine phosphatase
MWIGKWFKPAPPALSVAWDMHAHWLPGVDDGAPDAAEGLAMLRALAASGCRGAVATPHVYPGLFENKESDLREKFEDFSRQVAVEMPGFSLQLAAEYMFSEVFFERFMRDDPELLRFGRSRDLMLVELPVRGEPAALGEALDHCRRRKQRIILAHVERYAYASGGAGLDRLLEWKGRGALLQLNASSCAGAYGSGIRDSARRIWREGLIDFVGSDMHRAEAGARDHAKGLAWLGAHPQEEFRSNPGVAD